MTPSWARPPENAPDTGARKPYRFTDEDRAKSADGRKRQYVETSLTCDICDARGTCPAFQPGSVCGIDPIFKQLPTRNAQDAVVKIQEIIAIMEVRTWRNYYFEQLRGGKPRWRVSRLFDKLLNYHLLLMRLFQELVLGRETIVLEPGTVLGDIFGTRR